MTKASKIYLMSVTKIWGTAPHSAFTDLIRFENQWICAFREAKSHRARDHGKIRLIKSEDGKKWTSLATLHNRGYDLRDPKLSIAPNGELLLIAGQWRKNTFNRWDFWTCFSSSRQGKHWTPFEMHLPRNQWLWRITWHQRQAYGITYPTFYSKRASPTRTLKLYTTSNGLDYQRLASWQFSGKPSEATIRFLKDNTAMAIIRRDEAGNNGTLIGTSKAPYAKWRWHESRQHLGGPNFIVTPSGAMWAAGRVFEDEEEKTALARLTPKGLTQVLTLPSGGGDCSYPGLVFHDHHLWLSYYSSHEGKSSIYLAKIKITED